MEKRILLATMVVLLSILNAGCYRIARYDGPYEGRIVDEENGKPIEGVVVLGWWDKIASVGAGGASHEFYDSKEVVTDSNGEFSIKGFGLEVLSSVVPMQYMIYKVGYMYEIGPWESLKEGMFTKDKVKWEGGKAIIPLRRLTEEERAKNGMPSRPPIPDEKMQLMTQEINKERTKRGLGPIGIGGRP